MGLTAKLVVVGGDVKVTEINLKLPATVGRGRGTTIMLPHPLVSRQHCELFERDGYLVVRDMGSLNGTYVGQEKITEAPVPPEALLTIGAVTFRAVYEASGTIPAVSASDTAIGMQVNPVEGEVADDPIMEVDFTETAPAPQAEVAPTPEKKIAVKTPAVKTPATKSPPAKTPAAIAPPPAAPVLPSEEEDSQAEAVEAEDDFQSFLKSLGNG